MADILVALLRGINVGPAKRVAMSDLRTIVTDLGGSDVRTLLNSGNVIFRADDAGADYAGQIETALVSRLGVQARVIVLTGEELAVVLAENPIKDAADYSRLIVAIPSAAEDLARLQPLAMQDWSPEVLAIGPHAAYLWCPDGVLAGRLFTAVGKTLGDQVTTRNWSTMLKLAQKPFPPGL